MKSQTQSAYTPRTELGQAVDAVHKALADRKTLDAKVDAMPEAIAVIEQNVAKLEAELGAKEGDHAIADEGTAQQKKLAKEIADLTSKLFVEQQSLRSAHIRLVGLEGKAPQLDEEVRACTQDLQIEVTSYFESVKPALSAELEQAVKPILGILAKARVFGRPMQDTVRSLFIPDPVGFVLREHPLLQGYHYDGKNLLEGDPSEEQQAEAHAISEMIAPAFRALAAGSAHQEYVPLEKRPKKYVIKGYTHEGVTRTQATHDLANSGMVESPDRKPMVAIGLDDISTPRAGYVYESTASASSIKPRSQPKVIDMDPTMDPNFGQENMVQL